MSVYKLALHGEFLRVFDHSTGKAYSAYFKGIRKLNYMVLGQFRITLDPFRMAWIKRGQLVREGWAVNMFCVYLILDNFLLGTLKLVT